MATPQEVGMQWTSPEPGVHVRRLDSLEGMFADLADLGAPLKREQWAVTSCIQLSFSDKSVDPTEHLKKSWAAMRRLNPLLGSTISAPEGGEKMRYYTVKDIEDEAWIEKTFSVSAAAHAQQLGVALRPSDLGMIWLPASGELIVCLSHWKIDGMGTLRFWANFLTLLASFLRDGLDSNPVGPDDVILTRSTGDLFGSSEPKEKASKSAQDISDRMIGMMIAGMPSIGPPIKPGSDSDTAIPGATRRCSITLDEEATTAIISQCQAKHVSVGAMIHTALLRAIAKYPQHPLAKNVSALVPVDLRRHLPHPFNASTHASGAYSSGHPLHIKELASKSFDQIAKETNDIYRMDFAKLATDEKGQPIGLPRLTAPFARGVSELLATPPPANTPPMTTPSVSSLGVVERYVQREYAYGDREHQKVVVESFMLASDMLGKDMWSHISTFRGRLNVPMVFNGSYHDDAHIQKMLEDAKAELLEGLKIRLS